MEQPGSGRGGEAPRDLGRTWFGIETAYFVIQFSLIGVALGLIHARARYRAPAVA